jgi:small subunit ribosomal protein S13
MSTFIDFNNKTNKKLIYALRDVYGLGLSTSQRVCKSLGYDINTKLMDFRSEDLNKLTAIVSVQYKFIIGAELKKRTYDNIQQMKNIRCYKGVRHSYNLPVNGQRTHTNAKTRG